MGKHLAMFGALMSELPVTFIDAKEPFTYIKFSNIDTAKQTILFNS